jgi:hypothetical protein
MFNVLASFDEYELDIRREYWAETKARVMKERGVHLGRTPIGYLRASKQPKHACDITLARATELLADLGSDREPVSGGLVPDPALAPIIRRVFELRASGAQYPELLGVLDREAKRPSGRLWTHTQVARMLTLRVYLGEVGQADLVVPGAHEAIVDEALFARAQAVQKRRPARSPAADFHLRGVIRCAGCGFPMTGWNQPRVRASGAVERVRVYRCVRRRGGGACESRSVITADAVEDLVRAAAQPYVAHLTATSAPSTGDESRVSAIAAEIGRIDERLRRLTSDDEDALWADLIAEQSVRKSKLLAERASLQATVARNVTTTFVELDRAEQFEILREALDAVIVSKTERRGQPVEERVALYAAGTVGHLLPSKANDWRIRPFDFSAADLAASVESQATA